MWQFTHTTFMSLYYGISLHSFLTSKVSRELWGWETSGCSSSSDSSICQNPGLGTAAPPWDYHLTNSHWSLILHNFTEFVSGNAQPNVHPTSHDNCGITWHYNIFLDCSLLYSWIVMCSWVVNSMKVSTHWLSTHWSIAPNIVRNTQQINIKLLRQGSFLAHEEETATLNWLEQTDSWKLKLIKQMLEIKVLITTNTN